MITHCSEADKSKILLRMGALLRARHFWLAVCLLAFALCSATTPSLRAQSDPGWHVEVVDDGKGDNVGRYSALAIDNAGNLHVGYYDEEQKSLRYAFRGPGKRWDIMTVDKPAGTYVSIAVDALNHPHFAYNSPFETGLHYAYWDGKDWHKLLIDKEATDHFLSMQLDSKGNPYISYYREVYPDRSYALYLKYAYSDGKTWYVETLDHHMQTGKFNSLALDAKGNPQIAYSQVEAGDLRTARWDGTHWQFGTADARRTHNDYVGIGNSIAVDSDGNPCIAYFDATARTVKYAWQKDGVWQTEVVDQLWGLWVFNDRVSLKLDSHGKPHIAFFDHGLGALRYASKNEKGWHAEVVENRGHVGGYPSLEFGPDDRPYIAFYDMNDGQIRLAERDLNPPPPPTSAKEAKP
jgi:hypothetical protein